MKVNCVIISLKKIKKLVFLSTLWFLCRVCCKDCPWYGQCNDYYSADDHNQWAIKPPLIVALLLLSFFYSSSYLFAFKLPVVSLNCSQIKLKHSCCFSQTKQHECRFHFSHLSVHNWDNCCSSLLNHITNQSFHHSCLLASEQIFTFYIFTEQTYVNNKRIKILVELLDLNL